MLKTKYLEALGFLHAGSLGDVVVKKVKVTSGAKRHGPHPLSDNTVAGIKYDLQNGVPGMDIVRKHNGKVSYGQIYRIKYEICYADVKPLKCVE